MSKPFRMSHIKASAMIVLAAITVTSFSLAEDAATPKNSGVVDVSMKQSGSRGTPAPADTTAASTSGRVHHALPETEIADYSFVFPEMIGGPEPVAGPTETSIDTR